MKDYKIINGKIITADSIVYGQSIVVEDGIIRKIAADCSEYDHLPIIDAEENHISPGFVEVHIHGCGDYGFDQNEESVLAKSAEFLASKGVNTFLPTMQCDEEILRKVTKELEETPGLKERVPGLYLEGPFICEKRKGGILSQYIRTPDVEYLKRLIDLTNGNIRLMTIAPELEGVELVVDLLLENNIIPSFGHSSASLEELKRFSSLSISECNITHLFNAMSPVSHKTAGLAQLPFINRNVFFEVNADSIHLNRDTVQMCYNYLNHEKMILISDAVISAGGEFGIRSCYGREIESTEEEGVRYLDNGVLMGSNYLIPHVMRTCKKMTNGPLYEVTKFATLNPFKLLKQSDEKGSIRVGKKADLIIIDENFNLIRNLVE